MSPTGGRRWVWAGSWPCSARGAATGWGGGSRSQVLSYPWSSVRFMTAGAFGRAVGRLRAAVDELLAADVSELEQASLLDALKAFEDQRRRLEAVDQRLLMQANDSGLATACASASVAAL